MIEDIVRERLTRERLEKLDMPELIDEIHALEDQTTSLEAERDRLRELLNCAMGKRRIRNLEDEYARLWQMYGELEDERDRLREALEKITRFDDPPKHRVDVNTAYSVAVGAVSIARAALQEAGDE